MTKTMPPLKPARRIRKKTLSLLYPRERWTPSEWAERCRVLSEEESSEPGPYSFARTPFWRSVCDYVAMTGVEEVVCLKGAQVGWSELCRNVMGFWVDLDPGPCMVLMPDELSANAFREERISPLMRNTPAVKRHVSGRAWDTTKNRIRFDTMSMFFVWAGSKTGTKTRPIRYLVCEEPDEYPAFSSTGGDPLSKAEKRLTTYRDKGRARLLIGGTPTNRQGNVWKRWEMCGVQLHYWVPCPHCNGYQMLLWKQVRWDKREGESRQVAAERIKREVAAHYECEHCKQPIRDHEKPRMLGRGVWAGSDQVVTQDGRIVGPLPKASRVGFKISSLYSPWVPFCQLAAEWIESQDDPQALADFVNQRLAEPFEEQRAKTDPTLIEEKAKGAPPAMVVPKWARVLIATADTQGTDESTGYFYYVIRAWGYDYRSQLIDFGVASSKGELVDRCLTRQIPMESGGLASPQILLVDSGGPRWSEIYQLAQSDARIRPTKGASASKTWMVEEKPQKGHGVVLWMIDPEQSKDLLHRLIHDPDRTKWMPHREVNADYCRQMGAESKVWDPSTRREVWTEIIKNANHFWDCEHQQAAAAWRMGCGVPDPGQDTKYVEQPRDHSAFHPTGYRGRW